MSMRAYLEDGGPVNVKADEEGRLYVVTNPATPLRVTGPDGSAIGGDAANGTAKSGTLAAVAITGSSQSSVLPVADGTYLLQAWGDVAFVATGSGSGPTVSQAASGFSLIVADGATVGPIKLSGDYISWIGTTTGGYLTFCPVEG